MNLEKNKPTKIFLIGQSGSGKTTLGKKLSTKLKFDFLDTDEYITNELTLSISEIFNSKGELFFRNEEKKLLQLNDFKDKKFDIIFLDPPFKDKNINKLLRKILDLKIAHKSTLIVIHRNKKFNENFIEDFKNQNRII